MGLELTTDRYPLPTAPRRLLIIITIIIENNRSNSTNTCKAVAFMSNILIWFNKSVIVYMWLEQQQQLYSLQISFHGNMTLKYNCSTRNSILFDLAFVCFYRLLCWLSWNTVVYGWCMHLLFTIHSCMVLLNLTKMRNVIEQHALTGR